MQIIYLFFLAIVFNILLTPYLLNKIKEKRIVTYSRSRDALNEDIPRIGGFLIIFALFVALSFYSVYDFSSKLILSFIIISICGIVDDLKELPWEIKIVLQLLASITIASYLFESSNSILFLGIAIDGIPALIFLTVFIIGIMNSINLLDGLDGLLGGFAIIVSGILIPFAFVQNNLLVLSITSVTAGSLVAFLRYNAYPAKIHLGDSGSLIIGFVLVVSSLILTQNVETGTMDLTFVLILLSVPIVDMVRVFTYRLWNRTNPFMSDLSHLHHKFLDLEISVANTSLVVLLVSVVNSIFAALYLSEGSYLYFIASIIITLLLILEGHYKFIAIPFSRMMASIILDIKFMSRYKKERNIILGISSTIFILFILYINIPVSSFIIESDLIRLLIAGFVLLLVALYLLAKLGIYYHLFFFLNVLLFFILSQINLFESDSTYKNYGGTVSWIFSELSIYFIVAGAITIFLKRILSETKTGYLRIIDVNILYVVVLSFVLEKFSIFDFLSVLNPLIMMAFLIYLWYRSVSDFLPRTTTSLYVGSFLLTIFSLLKLLFL